MRSTARRYTYCSHASIALLAGLVMLTGPLTVLGHADKPHEDANAAPIILAPGYEKLDFPAPAPGSYALPVIGEAGNGNLLTSSNQSTTLHTLLTDKISVLSFIYRACDDVNGCPLATYVLHQIQQKLAADSALHDRVQLLSVSFDPVYDTPEAMQAYRDRFSDSPINWQFLTTASTSELDPLLEAYDQSLSRRDDGSNQINHMLRVFLIDESRQVRNIFSSSLLHADTLISDIKTLVLGTTANTPSVNENSRSTAQTLVAAAVPVETTTAIQLPSNDARTGYADGSYTSNTKAVIKGGTSADLWQHATSPILGLPALPGASDMSRESIELGKQLFFDRRLSINNTFSCAMCHIPQQGFTVNEMATAVGVEGRTVKRNAPSLLNVGYLSRLFHDGRESRLEQQVWSPLLAHNEMANPSIGYVLDKIAAIDSYSEQFERLYGQSQPTMETLGKAMSDYQRSLVAGASSFDRWRYGNESDALTSQAQLGYTLFTGKAQCSQCHTLQAESALFTDELWHNTGIGYTRSMKQHDEPHPVTLAPGVTLMVDPAVYADAAEEPPNDLGLYEVTQNPDDRWKFRTPSLRNVALTAPYMHDGSLATLKNVIEFYVRGGDDNELLSPLIKPLELSQDEQSALVHFLQSLTSPDVPMLVSDALATPVGDVRSARLH